MATGRILLEKLTTAFAIGSGLRHFPKVQRVHIARSITVGFDDLGRSIAHIKVYDTTRAPGWSWAQQ